MSVARRCPPPVVLASLMLATACCAPLWAAQDRAQTLLGLAVSYGNAHFDPALNLVNDAAGTPDIPDYSLPYALALLELGSDTLRAKAVLLASLAAQDVTPKSPTWGLFRRYHNTAGEGSRGATYLMAPLLARAYVRHATALGEEATKKLGAALAGALAATGRPVAAETVDENLQRLVAHALLGHALGQPAGVEKAVAEVKRWVREIPLSGRPWPPSPRGDALRLLALSALWSVAPEAERPGVERLLRLCYLDFAQRVHPATVMLAGAMEAGLPDEYVYGRTIAAFLAFRDLGSRLPVYDHPLAALVAVSPYQAPPEISKLVVADFKPYMVHTASTDRIGPVRTDTYLRPDFTLGTMTGWCLGRAVPVFATFGHSGECPTAYFVPQGGPAHVDCLQVQNLAICSFDFDRVGQGNRRRVWVQGNLGSVKEIQEVYSVSQEWAGEPAAIGTRDTVVVKRHGGYVAVTVLDCGPLGSENLSRRKPAILQWSGTGEYAFLELSIYGRYEEYRLRAPEDNYRVVFVVQVWGLDQFDTTEKVLRWLNTARVRQTASTAEQKVPVVEEGEPETAFDRGGPKPKKLYIRRIQHLQTIEYAYNRGQGNAFTLLEDLGGEVVIGRAVNGRSIENPDWWQSPAFTLAPKQPLEAALAPPSPKPEPPPPKPEPHPAPPHS